MFTFLGSDLLHLYHRCSSSDNEQCLLTTVANVPNTLFNEKRYCLHLLWLLSCSLLLCFWSYLFRSFCLILTHLLFPILPFQPSLPKSEECEGYRSKDCTNCQLSKSVCFGPFQEGKQCRKYLVGQACARLLLFEDRLYTHEKFWFLSVLYNFFQ